LAHSLHNIAGYSAFCHAVAAIAAALCTHMLLRSRMLLGMLLLLLIVEQAFQGH
jgi:hypothetical protein